MPDWVSHATDRRLAKNQSEIIGIFAAPPPVEIVRQIAPLPQALKSWKEMTV
jgi:hypothetical protein